MTATARGSTWQVVEMGPDLAQNSSRTTSRITSEALALKPAPKAAAAPAPKSEPTELEAGYRSVVAWGDPQERNSWRREGQTLQENDLCSL